MTTATIPATCVCGSLSPEVVLCSEHHEYFRNGQRLASVSSVIRSCWPVKPDFSRAPEGVLENARDRGIVVDALFSAYVAGTLTKIPAGTRKDARDLFFKLRLWWDAQGFDGAESQVILADDAIAGTCDVRTSEWIFDVKATYSIEPSYHLQLGAYQDMDGGGKRIGIIHVTERFPAPKLIELNADECRQDWRLLRDTYLMAQRRIG